MWLIITLLAISLFSGSAFIDKYVLEKRVPDPLLMIVFGGLLNLVLGSLFFILLGFPLLPVRAVVLLVLSGTFLTLYLIPYLYALLGKDTSLVVPLFQMNPAFTIILSAYFLKEQVSGIQLIGFTILLISGFLLSVERFDLGMFRPRKQLYLMMLSCICIAASAVLFKAGALSFAYPVSFTYQLLGSSIAALCLLIYSPFRNRSRALFTSLLTKSWKVMLGNELINLIAEFLINYAYLLAPVALVNVVSGSNPFFLLSYGFILTHFYPRLIQEDIGRKTMLKKISIFIVMLLGIACISL